MEIARPGWSPRDYSRAHRLVPVGCVRGSCQFLVVLSVSRGKIGRRDDRVSLDCICFLKSGKGQLHLDRNGCAHYGGHHFGWRCSVRLFSPYTGRRESVQRLYSRPGFCCVYCCSLLPRLIRSVLLKTGACHYLRLTTAVSPLQRKQTLVYWCGIRKCYRLFTFKHKSLVQNSCCRADSSLRFYGHNFSRISNDSTSGSCRFKSHRGGNR